MDARLIAFLLSLAVAALLAGPLAGVLRRHPAPFYIVSFALVAAYVWATFERVSPGAARPLFIVVQKGYLAAMLLGVVMFTGCFDEGTKFRKHFQPIRGELSILSFIFFLGHIMTYLPSYLGRFSSLLATRPSIFFSLVIAIVLTVIFLALGVTSFKFVRKHMSQSGWKRLQSLSYVMMALLALHIGLVLGRSAFSGGFTLATASFLVYACLLALYAVLRIRKAVRDKRRKGVSAGGTLPAEGNPPVAA